MSLDFQEFNSGLSREDKLKREEERRQLMELSNQKVVYQTELSGWTRRQQYSVFPLGCKYEEKKLIFVYHGSGKCDERYRRYRERR